MEKNKDDIRVGKLARSQKVATVVAKVGAKKIAQVVKSPFLDKKSKEIVLTKFNEETSKLIFEALVSLRGSALKMAQMLSLELDLLPEVYQRELAKSCYRVPPLNRALARKMFIAGLGKPPEDFFTDFNYDAFAAASLGQVHNATLPDGQRVAVKLQYPGIKQTLQNDLGLIKGILSVHPQKQQHMKMLGEIEERLLEETDYLLEAKNTERFKSFLNAFSSRITIPEIYKEYCSPVILTTSLLTGSHPDEWLSKNPSQKLRDKVAQSIFDASTYLFYEVNTLHADPNPGNYLFSEDGKVSILDFGCIKEFSKEFVGKYNHLMRLLTSGKANKEVIIEAYFGLGTFTKKNGANEIESFYEKTLIPYNEWVALPYLTDSFDFSKNQGYIERGRNLLAEFVQFRNKSDGVNTNFIYHGRAWFGLYRIFEKLGAKVNFRNKWEYDM
ncbi:MAG: ABC1 kinase family protein [Bacteroidia bacterium]